jgi:SAM-dependent methyltransferase
VTQDKIFAAFEGNRWFARNKAALQHYESEADMPLRLLALYDLSPKRVLEVGAANGFRLATLATRYGARVVAVEPSTDAIADGRATFPSVEFVHGEARALPLRDSYDLVIINFVLHWIDRCHLLRVIAEIDRVVADGGYLLIGDFCPSHPTKVPYHHYTETAVYTYKQNYAAPFLASGLYHLVSLITSDHATKTMRGEVSDHERVGTWLLRKRLTENYHERTTSYMSGVRSPAT